jgi:Pyruvate/2-oxoacid:ferredoxin oxidoreductase gamma subunit
MSFDFVVAGVGGQPIDRLIELLAGACAAADQPMSSTAPRGITLLGGPRLAQVSVGEAWSPIVTEDTGGFLLGLEVCEALRAAKYCAFDGVALVDTTVLPPAAPRSDKPYPGPAEVEPALKEVIKTVHVADFGALCAKAGASSGEVHAFLLGALSRVKGMEFVKDGWKAGLKAANATEAEAAAFHAGAKWADGAGLSP